jgi:hypothetical protein
VCVVEKAANRIVDASVMPPRALGCGRSAPRLVLDAGSPLSEDGGERL